MFAGLLTILGAYAFRTISIDAFPDVTSVLVQIVTKAPGLSPEEMERLVTFPIEQQVTGVPHLTELRSLTKVGLSLITVVFDDRMDINLARQLVLERLIEVRENLPPGSEPMMTPNSTGLGEVYQYYLEGPSHAGLDAAAAEHELIEQRTAVDWIIRPLLKGVPGVIDVNSQGGYVKQYQVLVEPELLRKYDLALHEVFAAVANNNANASGNVLETYAEKYIVRGVGMIQKLSDIEDIVVKEVGGTPVHIHDVAQVQIGHAIRHGAVVLNGEREVAAGIVLMLRGGNARDVVEGIKGKIAEIQEKGLLPRPTPLILILVALALPAAGSADDSLSPVDPSAAETAPRTVPLEEIQRYVAVYRAIQDAYVEPLDDKALMKAALRGLLTDLDPHSAYLDEAEAEDLMEQSEGAYSGIGVEIEQRPDRSMMVVAPIDGTPAQRAGLRAGDLIIAVDGQPLSAAGADAASRELRGEPGTDVTITFLRSGETEPRDLVITRELIRVTSVSSRLLEPGYAYLRISTFQADTGPQVARQLEAMKDKGPLRGVVLDLRSNPGGLLNAAVEAADAFMDKGLIVSTKGRLAYSNSRFHAKPGDVTGGAPVVVLVDAGTASAAEVLAGALRDQKRALVMGSRTFGKGSVQTVVPLENGDSVKLTTARYFTPSGKSIQARGIRPDVVLRGEATRGLREQDLPGHLRGDEEVGDGYARGEVIEGDAAIAQALARLKSDRLAAAKVSAEG